MDDGADTKISPKHPVESEELQSEPLSNPVTPGPQKPMVTRDLPPRPPESLDPVDIFLGARMEASVSDLSGGYLNYIKSKYSAVGSNSTSQDNQKQELLQAWTRDCILSGTLSQSQSQSQPGSHQETVQRTAEESDGIEVVTLEQAQFSGGGAWNGEGPVLVDNFLDDNEDSDIDQESCYYTPSLVSANAMANANANEIVESRPLGEEDIDLPCDLIPPQIKNAQQRVVVANINLPPELLLLGQPQKVRTQADILLDFMRTQHFDVAEGSEFETTIYNESNSVVDLEIRDEIDGVSEQEGGRLVVTTTKSMI